MNKYKGEKVHIEVSGIPPHKDVFRSIRNKTHPAHNRFLALRDAAKKAMAGVPYYKGQVGIKFHYVRKDGEKPIWRYLSGICDTLDGSHGFTFHWVPVVFLDDCQVVHITATQEHGEKDKYFLEIEFL